MSKRCRHPDGVTIKPNGRDELDACLYKDIEIYTNCTVIVSRCKRCGNLDFRWMRTEETERIDLGEDHEDEENH